jgi:hypothetical protein
MDWQRERDGLVVVGAVLLLLVVVALGDVRGFVATFVATFLGVLAALQVSGVVGEEPDPVGTTPTVGGSAGEPSGVADPGRATGTSDAPTTDDVGAGSRPGDSRVEREERGSDAGGVDDGTDGSDGSAQSSGSDEGSETR